jgi:hypothetical protein
MFGDIGLSGRILDLRLNHPDGGGRSARSGESDQ